MDIQRFDIEGPILIIPDVFRDERGDFIQTFSMKEFDDLLPNTKFVQDNQSRSFKNVLRGLHFQRFPHEQGKLVRVSQGAVMDVIVDVRPSSPTYGQHLKFILNDQNCHMLWVPTGFAHGFLTLEHNTVFNYKCSGYYHKPSEGGIRWDDKYLGIDWGVESPIVSSKDMELPSFEALKELHSAQD
jgi:dTDP-4-dehydrorhamnose 3,5-epimerase